METSISRLKLEDPPPRYRWLMLALLWSLYLCFGMVVRGIALLVTPIIDDLGISFSEMGLVLGAWQFTYIISSVFAGTILDKLGVRRSLFIGIIIIVLSTMLRYFTGGFLSLLIFVAIFGLGGPLISIGGPKTISLWFQSKERGTAMGIFMTGHLVGGLIVFSLTNSLVMPVVGYSWRLAFVVYGAFILLVALAWLLLARDVNTVDGQAKVAVVEVFRRLIKERSVRILIVMGFCGFTLTHGFMNWLPKILETGGLSPAMAGYASSISVLGTIPSVLLLPRLVPPKQRARAVSVLGLLVAGVVVLAVSIKGWLLLVALALFGATAYALLPMLLLMLMETAEVPTKYLGAAGGIFFCLGEIGGFTGPFIMGTLKDWGGSFLTGALFLSLAGITIFIMATLLPRGPSRAAAKESLQQ